MVSELRSYTVGLSFRYGSIYSDNAISKELRYAAGNEGTVGGMRPNYRSIQVSKVTNHCKRIRPVQDL